MEDALMKFNGDGDKKVEETKKEEVKEPTDKYYGKFTPPHTNFHL